MSSWDSKKLNHTINEQNKVIQDLIIQVELCRSKIVCLERLIKRIDAKLFDTEEPIQFEDIYLATGDETFSEMA